MVDVDTFRACGFVKIEQPELRSAANDARAQLWHQLNLDPDHPDGWSQPVRWAADLTGDGPFGALVRSRVLSDTLDRICGCGGWIPRNALGNIPVRFPVSPPAEDRGWHIDLNTPRGDGTWWVSGVPHTILLLTLLSEVGPDGAPTRIRVGSHQDVAEVLGAALLDGMDAGPIVDAASRNRPVVQATGAPGDMYLVHPFTVHAADEHRGRTPRFMAQSPVMLTAPMTAQRYPGLDALSSSAPDR